MTTSLVFSIEEFSVFDGPGIRSTVFLKGCPLRCEWCHNPEGQSFQNEILRSSNGCIKCGNCQKFAKHENSSITYTEQSVKSCPQGLLRPAAVEYTPEALCNKLLKNEKILNSANGGVTFSGGEPTASSDFLLNCLDLLKGRLHRAVQTCGYCSEELFEKLLHSCEYMLFDIKLAEDRAHKKYTGVSNDLILKNFKRLASSNMDFVIRTPLIPSVTDTEENISAIAQLLRENNLNYIELMPYNRFAGSKYHLVGKTYSPSFEEKTEVNTHADIFKKYHIEAKVI